MPYRFSYTLSNYSDPYWGERPPRNNARSEVLRLNLFDGGHGDQQAVRNPMLRGLGATIVLDLNPNVRRFGITLEYNDGVTVQTKDLKPNFKSVAERRFEMQAVVGDENSIGFASISDADYDATIDFKIVITLTNITRTARIEYLFSVGSEVKPVLGCVTVNTADFQMFEQLQRAHLRLWRHIGSLDYDPIGSQQLTFWFDEAEILKSIEGGILCTFFNYFTDYHNGIAFTRDISADGFPEDYTVERFGPGFNPWDGKNKCGGSLEPIDEDC